MGRKTWPKSDVIVNQSTDSKDPGPARLLTKRPRPCPTRSPRIPCDGGRGTRPDGGTLAARLRGGPRTVGMVQRLAPTSPAQAAPSGSNSFSQSEKVLFLHPMVTTAMAARCTRWYDPMDWCPPGFFADVRLDMFRNFREIFSRSTLGFFSSEIGSPTGAYRSIPTSFFGIPSLMFPIPQRLGHPHIYTSLRIVRCIPSIPSSPPPPWGRGRALNAAVDPLPPEGVRH